MHLATLVCFCISAASAVKHYGLTPAEDVKNMVENHAQALSENDMNLTSLFTTDHHNSHDGADSLAAGGMGSIIGVVDSKICVEAGTADPLPSCKGIFAFVNTSDSTFTGITVNAYCPQFLPVFLCRAMALIQRPLQEATVPSR